MTSPVRLPEGFGLGVATASYQVEGAVADDGRKPSVWDTFAHTPGRIVNGDTGDIACDHYHRYAADVALLKDLGVQYYRFSLAWPRIQPSGRGALNPAGIDFYARLVDALLENGIKPWVTLYHWDLPQALEDLGGWPSRDTALYFADYAAATYELLKDRIEAWTTLNEPWCAAYLGYANGMHAPGVADPQAAIQAAHHLLLGHGMAVERMRDIGAQGNQFGITLNLWPVTAVSDADEDAARRVDGISNRFFLDPVLLGRYPADVLEDLVAAGIDLSCIQDGDEKTIAAPLDVLGVNYYNPVQVRLRSEPVDEPVAWVGCEDVESVPHGLPTTDMGWEIDPDGLRRLLLRLEQDYPAMPIYVTENGIALRDEPGPDGVVDDPERVAYIDGHLRAVVQAVEAGVDVRGYFLWTFTDNFEWSYGFSKRFGLVYLDYPTQARIPKTSAAWFARVCRTGEL